jgi:hypothetical protein
LQFWQWLDAFHADLFAIDNEALEDDKQPLAQVLHPNTAPENTEGVP